MVPLSLHTALHERDGFSGRRCDLLWVPDHDRGCSLARVNLDLQKGLQAQQTTSIIGSRAYVYFQRLCHKNWIEMSSPDRLQENNAFPLVFFGYRPYETKAVVGTGCGKGR